MLSVVSLLVLLTASVQGCDVKYEGNCPVDLGLASGFAILAKAGISTVPKSNIIGNIGVSPIAATAMTGFSLIADVSHTHSTSTQVSGKCFAADYTVPTSSDLTVTVLNMQAAFTDAYGRPNTNGVEFKAGLIGGETLMPGVYTWTSSINIASDIVLDGQGKPNSVFILQTSKSLVVAANVNVILRGGAQASNIFWAVSEAVTVGVGAHLEGNILAQTSATFLTHSSINGRILAQTAVVLQMTTVKQPGFSSGSKCGECKDTGDPKICKGVSFCWTPPNPWYSPMKGMHEGCAKSCCEDSANAPADAVIWYTCAR
jgi:hypothetical protein